MRLSPEGRQILVAIGMRAASPQHRLAAIHSALPFAVRAEVDELRLAAGFMETPPVTLKQAVEGWVNRAGQHGRIVVRRPSKQDIDAAVAASIYVESMDLLIDGELALGTADAADTLDLRCRSQDWEKLRRELEQVLGPFNYDVLELNGT